MNKIELQNPGFTRNGWVSLMAVSHARPRNGLGSRLIAVIGAAIFLASTSRILAVERQVVGGHVPAAAARLGLTALGRLPATNELHLAIALPVRNQPELDALIKDIYNPASRNFHHYLTPPQFAEKFGATKSDYQALIQFAQQNGLKVTGTHPNRLVLDVAGPVPAIENTFQVKLHVYNHPTENRTFYAPDTEPSVDASLKVPILSIRGLNNYSLPHPASLHLTPTNQPAGPKPLAGSAPSGNYAGRDFRTAYLPFNKLNGTDQSVALVEFDGYYSNDIAQYEKTFSLPYTTLTNVPVDGGVSSPNNPDAIGEVSLDIEMVVSMATNLTSILVYEEPSAIFNWPDILSQIADDDRAAQISCSWYSDGLNPDPASEQIFQQMAAQGQSFFNACGDSDAFVGPDEFPLESPYITLVGGTTLTTASRGMTRVSETVWNWGGGVGSTGGVSPNYPIPAWQTGINSFLTSGGSTSMRNVPDVAMTADNIWVIWNNGSSGSFGGTSCAAPLWAGFMALANQQAVAAGKPPVGFINPAIYEIANESIYATTFNDITKGSNTWSSSPNSFYAVPGYDLCTGLGTPKSTNLINALVSPDPLVVVSNGGFNSVGSPAGTFSITSQTYYLTNAGSTPLNWSVVNTSAWLNVSNTGGTLSAGGNDTVVVSLNPVANNLTAGIYSASLWFSNATNQVGHSRFFTLKINDPLVVSPQQILFTGPSGGPFIPGSVGVTLTNASADTFDWCVNNTSAWVNVSPASGSIPPGSKTSVAFNLTASATNLPDGFYSTVFQVTNLTSQFVQSATGMISIGIIVNGGFETGDFTGWTFAGDGYVDGFPFNAVASLGSQTLLIGSFIHSGSYGVYLADTNIAYLSQTVQTTPGQNYLLSFWLDNPQSGVGQEFFVDWNTNSASTNQIYFINSVGVLSWRKISFVLEATDTNTTLQFGAFNPTNDFDLGVVNDFGQTVVSAFGLDDISVIAVFPPAFTAQPTNVTVLAGGMAAFSAPAGGSVPLAYQWLANGANLANASGISGATTGTLTLAGVTTNSAGNYSLVITNAYGAITSSVATLTVVLPPSIGDVTANPSGSVTLNLMGSPGVSYVLESTTNFTSGVWQPMATNVFDVTGLWQFNDTSVTNYPQQFYRLRLAQ